MAVDPPGNTSRSAETARSGLDADTLQRDIIDNLICLQARYPAIATPHDWYMALAYGERDRMLALGQNLDMLLALEEEPGLGNGDRGKSVVFASAPFIK
ncbi:hypothetical protein P3T23_005554 [Paraburkholderia sp. GAS448]